MSRYDVCLRLARGLATLVCGLVALSGCGAPARVTLTVRAPAQLASSPWYTISLPADMRDMQSLVVAPTDPATLFACSTAVEGSAVPGATFSLWRSTDAGFHWTLLATPTLGGDNCVVAIAPEDARRVAVMAMHNGTNSDNAACEPVTIALSIDGGDQWHTVPFEVAPITPQPSGPSEGCTLQLGARYLYWSSSYSGALGSSQVTVLERGDAGGHWMRIDTPFGLRSLFIAWQFGDGDRLLASVGTMPSSPHSSYQPWRLWITHDGAATWRDMDALPLGVDSFVMPAPGGEPSGPTPQAPWYALIAEQIPSNLYRLQVMQSSDGRHWTALPPLPIPGTSAQRMGLLQALGVTPDGRLLALGPDPAKGVPPPDLYTPQADPTAFWLWIWSPGVGRWQVMPSPLRRPAHEGCGLCWYGQVARGRDGATYLYLDRGDKAAGLFRVRVPDAV